MQRYARSALQKLAVSLLALCIAIVPMMGATSESISSVSVESAPLSTVSTAQDGMVRVYLSSLGSPTTLTLTVAGSYSLSTGTSLTNGESLTVGFSTSTGAITLTRNGTKTNMGTYFALKRHSASGTNGIKIAQGRKPDNPYPGDISFQAVQQSSGSYKLYSIAHVYIEAYLYGVLPYEMGSSAPTEALKAQAVAARTYTVRMMANRSSGYYDVVDTTSDQVYNGTPTGYATCVAAVDATKGIVLKNNGSYTATYYGASNGGQTESINNIWGSTGYSYLGVQDDPFDYANPDSVVKKTTVYASCANSSNNSLLMALLKTKAIAALNSAGYSATTANTTLGTIKSIVAHTPMYSSPSKLYTKLDFTLTATTSNNSGTSVTATTTVTCGIFTELESLLSMSIQSGKNELWSVTTGTSSFTLEARRYGHGLGMSQRGAMYMGKLGYTYDKILGFYYPNCTRVGCTFTNTILAANSTEVITTEEGAATVDDGTSSDTCTAVVKLVSSNGSLAIRDSKSTSGTLLGVVANASPVTVYASDGTWCLIKYGGITGYVPANALTISGIAPATSNADVTSITGFATVTAGTYLNIRASGSYSASVLTTAPKGAVLTVFSKTSSWAYVQYGTTAGYASMDFLSFSSTYSGALVNTGTTSATVTVDSGSVAYLRATASTSGTVVTQLTSGIAVSVSSDDGSWAYVTYNGTSGYLLASNLTYADDTSSTGNAGGNTTTEPTTTVSASVGYLRVSADENSAMIMEVAMGQSVVLVSQGTTWSAVRYESVSGYMLTASLSIAQTSTGTSVTATVVTSRGSLNMRQEASAGSTILTTIPQGATVTVTSKGDTWSALTYNGYSGYAMTAYLQFTTGTNTNTDTSAGTATATVTTDSGSLNLRQLPKAGSTILTTIPRLTVITITTKGTDWSYVTYAGTAGYVMTAFLTFSTETTGDTSTPATDTATVTPTATLTPTVTETATATVTPANTDTTTTALTAIVTTTSGSLNLRADMLSGARVLTRIPKGTTITISQKLSTWSQTIYGGYTGYVLNSYLTFPSDTRTTTTTATTATVMTASGSLNMRSEPYGSVVATIPQYATVQVQQKGSTWSYVTYSDVNGYAMTAYLTFSTDSTTTETTATPAPTPTPAATTSATTTATTATVLTPSGSLNLRETASTSAQVLTTIPRLASVSVLTQGDTWCQVLYNAYTGYVLTTYLSFAADTVTATPTATTDTSTGITAWVNTTSGSLNLRESASSSAAVLVAMPRLSQVTLLSQGATWCQTQYGGLVGYAMTAYLTTTKPSEISASATATSTMVTETTATTTTTVIPTPTPPPSIVLDPTLQTPSATLYAYVTPKDSAVTLPLWEGCTEEKGRLLDMLTNSQVQILLQGDTWCQVLYFTQKGYCLTEGLTLIAE